MDRFSGSKYESVRNELGCPEMVTFFLGFAFIRKNLLKSKLCYASKHGRFWLPSES